MCKLLEEERDGEGEYLRELPERSRKQDKVNVL